MATMCTKVLLLALLATTYINTATGQVTQSTSPTQSSASTNMTAYIILGVVLGVVVIITIIILVVSCGKFNWNWRTANTFVKRTQAMSKNNRVRRAISNNKVQRKPRKIRTKKPRLKFGVKNTNLPPVENSNGSRSLFVIGEDARPAEPEVSLRQSGPHVARVDTDEKYVPPPQPANPQPIQPPPQALVTNPNPNVSHLGIQNMHMQQFATPHNIDVHSQVPIGIYPQLGNVMRPQHQINIHAPVPGTSLIAAPIQQPVHTHAVAHQQVVTQPGLYPQLGHTHAQVHHHAGHVHNATASQQYSPPAYQTMERTDVKM